MQNLDYKQEFCPKIDSLIERLQNINLDHECSEKIHISECDFIEDVETNNPRTEDLKATMDCNVPMTPICSDLPPIESGNCNPDPIVENNPR